MAPIAALLIAITDLVADAVLDPITRGMAAAVVAGTGIFSAYTTARPCRCSITRTGAPVLLTRSMSSGVRSSITSSRTPMAEREGISRAW